MEFDNKADDFLVQKPLQLNFSDSEKEFEYPNVVHMLNLNFKVNFVCIEFFSLDSSFLFRRRSSHLAVETFGFGKESFRFITNILQIILLYIVFTRRKVLGFLTFDVTKKNAVILFFRSYVKHYVMNHSRL